MLIGFKLKNFRSFLDQQTFSFLASSGGVHESTHCMRTGMKSIPRVSKAAIVFGPNASGKTNLLAALATLRNLMLYSTRYSEAQFCEAHTPFLFGASVHRATEFEIDVLLDGVRYRYSVAYDSRRITSERLLVYQTGKAQRWFDRHFDEATQKDEWAAFSPSFNGPREMWRKATRPKALFLTSAAQLNSEQLAPLLHWAEHCLEILFPADLADLGRLSPRIQDPEFKARILRLLRAADIEVDDVRVTDRDVPQRDHGPGASRTAAGGFPQRSGPPPPIEFLYAHEGWLPIWLDAGYEATGTHQIFNLLGLILAAIEHGKLLFIDGFDNGLHPLVARFLIQLITNPSVSRRGAQLVLTSHNTALMDLGVVRRDGIWLVQLDRYRASGLSPLLRAAPRKQETIAKGYLLGRYGAVPLIRPEPGAARSRGARRGTPANDEEELLSASARNAVS